MGSTLLQCFSMLFLFHLFLTSGSSVGERPHSEAIQKNRKLEDLELFTTQLDATIPVVNPTPGTTTPIVNPVTSPPPPTTMTGPITNPTPPTNPNQPTNPTPSTTPPASPGGQWCVASQTASQTALQVALDYACGYGGSDCSAIQPGGSCYNPNTIRDHASYAFNDYYHKNPAPTSCVFGGTAQLTSTDPSSGNCHYPSTTASTSMPPPANPTPPVNPTPTTTNPYTTPATPEGSTVYGSAEPTGLPSSATAVSCSLILFTAAAGFVWSLAENYV